VSVLLPVLLSVQAALIAVAVDLPIGWAAARWLAKDRAGARWLRLLTDLPLVLPPVVVGYALLLLLGPNGPLGLQSIAFGPLAPGIACATVALPLMVRSLESGMRHLPSPLLEQAATLGLSPRHVWWRVALPLLRPTLARACVLTFARALSEFGATIVLAGNLPGVTQTLPLAIWTELQIPGTEQKVLLLSGISVALSTAALWIQSRWARHA